MNSAACVPSPFSQGSHSTVRLIERDHMSGCSAVYLISQIVNKMYAMADLIRVCVFIGMQVLEWNSVSLTGKTYEEVQGLVGHQVGEAELCIRL